jgi:hypothetical protein
MMALTFAGAEARDKPGMKQDEPGTVRTNKLRHVEGGSQLDKPTFGEKFMMGLKKYGARRGRIKKPR